MIMADCKKCRFRSVCKKRPKMEGATIEECDLFRNDIERTEPMTNADRIRAMTDEEMAEWLVQKTVYQESAWSEPSYLNFLTSRDDTKENAIKGTVEWLKQPAKEGE